MSESEKDTRFKPIEIGAEVTRDDKTKGSSSDAERKRKLIEELTDNVEQIPRELPKIKQLVAQIPESGKLGQKFTVKLGKRFDNVNLKVYQGATIEENAGNTNIIHDKTEKNKDEISYDFYDPVPLQQRTINGLLAGKYLVKVEAHGTDATDQLEQERIVDITE